MTQIESKKTDETQIKRYLYAEMSAEEKDKFEESFFLDDDLFFEVTDLENRLVDLYAVGKLSGDELNRFEKSLEKFPERKEKAANAKALQTHIKEERPPLPIQIIEPEAETFWQKLAGFFTIQSPIFGSVMAGLLIVFGIAGILLFLDNRQKSEDIARLQNERQGNTGDWQKREEQLKSELANSSQRIEELQTQLADKDDDTGELIKSLNSEQQKNRQLERDLERVRQEIEKPNPTVTPKKEAGPTIASVILSKGNEGGKLTTTNVGENTKKLAVNIALPDEVKEGDTFSLKLNGQLFKQNVIPNKKSINLTISIKNLNIGENKLTVIDKDGKEITKYTFQVDKPED